ncbi:putative reverse transcriptase domain-containing protein [Tanacetum coccineum]
MQYVILFYNRLDIPTRQILDSRGAIPTMTAVDAKRSSKKWWNTLKNGIMEHLEEEVLRLLRKVKKRRTGCYTSTTKQSRKGDQEEVLQEMKIWKPNPKRGFGSLPSSTETNPRDQVKLISTTIEVDSHSICRIGSSIYAVSTGQNSTLLYKSRQMTVPLPSRLDNHYCEEEEGNHGPKFTKAYGASNINNIIPRKEKDLGSFTLPCFINDVCFNNALVDLGASVSVMPLSTFLNLGLGELAHTRLTVELTNRIVKYPKGIAENVLVGIGKFTFPVDFIILDMPEDIKVPLILGRLFCLSPVLRLMFIKESLGERMELDLEARIMGETLVLNRSLDPFLEDYIKLNDLNEPFELKRNQGDDLMPTIEEGEVIEEFRTKDEDLDIGIDDYPNYYDNDKKIHIDCAHNLKFSCMIGSEFTHVNFYVLLYVNVMSRKFHNSIMKNKMVYKGDNVIGALMNVPIFVGTFSVMTGFAVLEDMDAYRDEGMGDIIVGEPFLKEVRIKAKHFKGIITLYNGDDEVTYQMMRSHLRFKNHMNEQYNKIPPLLKISEKDVKNVISHAYQKLKGFYKGVLNLGPNYIRNAKTEEWLTRWHISVHEME